MSVENGAVISQCQFTELLLSQQDLKWLTLQTMAYNLPLQDGNAYKVHLKLLELARAGTKVRVGVDNSYANRIAPRIDLPIPLARLLGKGEFLRKKDQAYKDLASNSNVALKFNGREHAAFFPYQNIDHRKLLLMGRSSAADLGVVYGFNINHQLDPGIVDSGIVITDPLVLEWLQEQSQTPHFTPPTCQKRGDFTFVTRELVQGGNELANKKVVETIRSAEETIVFCGQWIPDGLIFDELIDAAKKGIQISIATNYPPLTRQPMYALFRYMAAKKLAFAQNIYSNIRFFVADNPELFFHLKGLIVDIDYPNKARAITGNDNMTNSLLMSWGLRDIMVQLDNHTHRLNLSSYINENVLANSKIFDPRDTNLMRRLFHLCN